MSIRLSAWIVECLNVVGIHTVLKLRPSLERNGNLTRFAIDRLYIYQSIEGG